MFPGEPVTRTDLGTLSVDRHIPGHLREGKEQGRTSEQEQHLGLGMGTWDGNLVFGKTRQSWWNQCNTSTPAMAAGVES